MAKNEKDKQTNNRTQHRKMKNKQHEPHQKLWVISGASEGFKARYYCHFVYFLWLHLLTSDSDFS